MVHGCILNCAACNCATADLKSTTSGADGSPAADRMTTAYTDKYGNGHHIFVLAGVSMENDATGTNANLYSAGLQLLCGDFKVCHLNGAPLHRRRRAAKTKTMMTTC